MSISEKDQRNIIVEIWNSFRATPGWVQFWMVFLLMPMPTRSANTKPDATSQARARQARMIFVDLNISEIRSRLV